MGSLYYAGSVKTPIHPRCRCSLSPITLEALVIQNQLAANRGERWEDQQQALAAATRRKYDEASTRPWRPIGGTGEPRGPRDYPLMERTALPATTPRPNTENNPANGGARPWPSGDPVWTPSRGWINAAAREAYDYKVAGANNRADASLSRSNASSARTGALLSGFGTVLGGASDVYKYRKSLKVT
jgi:hypothetical protein